MWEEVWGRALNDFMRSLTFRAHVLGCEERCGERCGKVCCGVGEMRGGGREVKGRVEGGVGKCVGM